VQKLILSGMVAMSGLVLLTFLRMDERCQQAKSAREEELAKKVQGAVSLLTTANGAQSPDDRCYNRLRPPGVISASRTFFKRSCRFRSAPGAAIDLPFPLLL